MRTEEVHKVFYLDIVTGDAEGADSDGAVGVRVCDRSGADTVEQVLGAAYFDKLTRGATDRHYVITSSSFTEPSEVSLELKTGQSWQVHEVHLIERKAGTRYSTGPQDVWLTHRAGRGTGHITLPLRQLPPAQVATAGEQNG